ncbi:haloacid dehalogenase-like hydrolase [Dictyocaulus viviparus]|uniref:Haloacid dehalogenase-like hydrolase n=1 Tax=Dictyocaulus viviparus TaxID=29172 RepID=A0A0D8XWW8_DICVI|nr:haloacid dehalogenase-like hydrolase [Dictyocaulus viviparus]
MTADNEVKLVIFDKDGTLVDFHRMWLPWAAETVQLLETTTGRRVGPAVYKTLGVDPIQGKVSMGSLAEKTLIGIRADVSATLQKLGIPAIEADAIVEKAVPEASNGETAPVCDLQKLFRELRALGCKSALCTADSRTATEQQMRDLGIANLLDDVVCGNDPGIIPKPSPHCALQICKRLGVPLKVKQYY